MLSAFYNRCTIQICVWTQQVGSLALFPEPIACWGCGVFSHRISSTFAPNVTSSLPPAESLWLLLLLPGGWHPLPAYCWSVFWNFAALYSAFMPCYVISFDVLVVLGCTGIIPSRDGTKTPKMLSEWMTVNKPLGLQGGCYIVTLYCLLLQNSLILLLF